MTFDGDQASHDLEPQISDLGYQWARSPFRPRVKKEICRDWDALIERWISSDVPLILRKGSKGRGAALQHAMTGRNFTYADNTPANWVMELAVWEQKVPDLDDIRALFDTGRMPLAMAFKAAEKEAVRYTSGGLRKAFRPNKEGWKVCHIDPVSPISDRRIEHLDLEALHRHFRRFLRPANIFLVPKRLGGIGEIDTFVDQIRQFEMQQERMAS